MRDIIKEYYETNKERLNYQKEITTEIKKLYGKFGLKLDSFAEKIAEHIISGGK